MMSVGTRLHDLSDHHGPNILIVEDDTDLRESLCSYLGDNHCKVRVAPNAYTARQLLARRQFDLVILDIMMPGEDGLSLCRHIQSTADVPVVLISAKSGETDRIIGMEIGADDYVTKPFNPRELLARIKAIIRRARARPMLQRLPSVHAYTFGDWTLRTVERELIGEDGVRMPLSGAEFRLLVQFLRYPNVVLSRDQLIESTQGRELGPYDRSIDNLVARLRKKIEPDIGSPKYIRTIWGGGYLFAADVRCQ